MLLSLVAAMNASQTMVLCIGYDGHMAVEPVGHHHCADGTHIHQSGIEAHRTGLIADTGGPCSAGCMDVPFAGQICSDPKTFSSSKAGPIGLAVVSTLLQPPADDTLGTLLSILPMLSADRHALPSCIVLQV